MAVGRLLPGWIGGKPVCRALAATVASALALCGLAWFAGDGEAWTALRAADTRMLSLAVPCCMAMLVFRWLRLSVVLRLRADGRLAGTFLAYNALVGLLPAKLGELSLPVLLRRRHGASMWHGGTALVLTRAYDLLCVTAIGAAALLGSALAGDGAAGAAAASLALPVLAAAMAGMMFLPWLLTRALTLVGRRPGGWAAQAADALAPLGSASLAHLVGLTACIWASLALAWVLVSAAVPGGPGAMGAMLAGSASSLAFALPVSGPGTLGPAQGAWAVAASASGAAPGPAVATALLAHLVPLLTGLVAAGAQVAWSLVDARKGPAPARRRTPSSPDPTEANR